MANHDDQERRDAAESNDNVRAKRPVPSWKKKLIAGALAIVVLGGAAQVMSTVRDRTESSTSPPPARVGDASGTSATSGSRGFVSSSPQQSGSSQRSAVPESSASREHALWEKAAPYVTKFGLSFLAGLIVGLVFRAFVKTMAFITALLAVGLFCLSYFHIFNFDSSQVRQNYDGIAGWAREHALALKDAALHVLPSGTLGAVGFFAGVKKH